MCVCVDGVCSVLIVCVYVLTGYMLMVCVCVGGARLRVYGLYVCVIGVPVCCGGLFPTFF